MCYDFVVLLIYKLHISALPSDIVMKLSSLRSLGPSRFILHSIAFREEPLLPLSVGLETVQVRQPLTFLAYLSFFPACDHFFPDKSPLDDFQCPCPRRFPAQICGCARCSARVSTRREAPAPPCGPTGHRVSFRSIPRCSTARCGRRIPVARVRAA